MNIDGVRHFLETTPPGINIFDADPRAFLLLLCLISMYCRAHTELDAYDILPPGLRKRFADLIQIAKDACGGMLVRDSRPCLEGHVYAEQVCSAG
jgi:hypothetical protein